MYPKITDSLFLSILIYRLGSVHLGDLLSILVYFHVNLAFMQKIKFFWDPPDGIISFFWLVLMKFFNEAGRFNTSFVVGF